MAYTDFGSLSAAQQRVWTARAWRQRLLESFWYQAGMMGDGENASNRPVQVVKELKPKGVGNVAVMQLIAELTGDGTRGDDDITNQTEALVNDSVEIRMDQLRHSVQNRGRLSDRETVHNFRMQARQKLGYWLSARIDELLMLTASGLAYTNNLDRSTRSESTFPNLTFAADVSAPTTNRIKYAGTATSTGTLTTSHKLTWSECTKLKAFAERKLMKPVRENGENWYCLLISPEQARDLKQDSDYQTIVSRAAPRSKDNDLFKGALSAVDGLVIKAHNRVTTTLGLTSGVDKWGAGSDVDGAQALLLGAQALGFAEEQTANWNEETENRGNQNVITHGQIFGMVKPKYRSVNDNNATEDFGVVAFYTAAAA